MLALFALPCLSSGSAAPAQTSVVMNFVYHRDPTEQDDRNRYAWTLLAAALDHTRDRYGDYSLTASDIIDERPNAYTLMTGEGGITVSVFTPRAAYDGKLIPVRIPIDRGMLGLRVLLIHAADQKIYNQVRTLADLRRIRFGALAPWVDVTILRNAGLSVVTGSSFDGLFKMLVAGRFDAFSRGYGEATAELAQRRQDLPGIVIESHLLFRIPMPVYFWFADSEAGRRRAVRVREGLLAMIDDGSFDTLFRAEFGPIVERLNSEHRRIIDIANPLLGPDEPLDDDRLWFRPG